jgi:hypothetical protein
MSSYSRGVALGRAINREFYKNPPDKYDMKVCKSQDLHYPFYKTKSLEEEREDKGYKEEQKKRDNVLITLYGKKEYKEHRKDYQF